MSEEKKSGCCETKWNRDNWPIAAAMNGFTGVLPDLFQEGQGMIGTGQMVGGVFQATEILAKHDETYMPKEVIEALKEQGVYVDPNGS